VRTTRRLLTAALVVATVACVTTARADEAANKKLVQTFNDATNGADWDALAEVVADDFARHSAATQGPPVKSRDEFVALQQEFLKSFPDQRVTIEHIIAEGDYVAIRAVYTGTQKGPMGDMPATGKSVEAPFLAMFRIESGKIAELWVEWDNLNMLGQLGLFPPPGASE